MTVPVIELENSESYGWFFLDEIQNLSRNIDYLREIVKNMEGLLAGDIDNMPWFGFHTYSFACNENLCRVLNILEDETLEAEIATSELFQFLRDWLDFIELNVER